MAELILTGEEKVKAFLLKLAQSAPKKLAAGLYQVGNEALTASKKRVPVDTGALRMSGQIDAPKVNRDGASVRLGYGDTAVDYALIVHEDTKARHPIGQSHYLSSVIDELRPTFLRKVGEQLVLSR